MQQVKLSNSRYKSYCRLQITFSWSAPLPVNRKLAILTSAQTIT